MKLVGLVVFNNQVIEDDADRLPTDMLFTPALTRTALTSVAVNGTWYAMQLVHGDSDLSQIEEKLIRMLPSGSDANFTVTSITETKVERAVKPESIALGVFGAIAALAAFAIGGLAISRVLGSVETDLSVLRALGAGPGTTAADGLVGVLGAIVFGSLLSVAVAVSLSPLSPLGPIRAVYHPPGISFDWTVLGFGFLVLIGGLGMIALVLAYRGAPHRVAAKTRIDHPRESRLLQTATSRTVGLRCRGTPFRSPVRAGPHLGPRPFPARRRHLGRGRRDHDAHVQQWAPYLGVTSRTVRVELELRADVRERRSPASPCRSEPRS